LVRVNMNDCEDETADSELSSPMNNLSMNKATIPSEKGNTKQLPHSHGRNIPAILMNSCIDSGLDSLTLYRHHYVGSTAEPLNVQQPRVELCHNSSRSNTSVSILSTSPITTISRFTPPSTLRSTSIVPTKRPYLDDLRPFRAQFQPQQLILSTLRCSLLTVSQNLTGYLSDQLNQDAHYEELVTSGKLTEEEAELAASAKSDGDWDAILETLPRKVVLAILKYQSVTFCMRCMEQFLFAMTPTQAGRSSKHDTNHRFLDRLTKDAFSSALRKDARTDGNERYTVGRQMVKTSFYSNILPFLADYTVQQIILLGGYYMYYHKRKISGDGNTAAFSVLNGGMFFIIVQRSCELIVSRFACLSMSSLGAGVGTFVWPGWGTTLGGQLGDGLTANFFDKEKDGKEADNSE